MSSTPSIFDVRDSNVYGVRGAPSFEVSLFPYRTFMPSGTLLTAVLVSIAAILFTGLFFYQAHAEFASGASSVGAVTDPSSGTIYLSGQAAAGATSASRERPAPMLEMHIANNGLILLEGARVLSLSGGRIRVEMKWGSETFTWVAQTNSKTKYFARNGEKSTLASIHVGDMLTVTGMLTGGGALSATFVRAN